MICMSSFIQFSNCALRENKGPEWKDYLQQKLEIDGIYENTTVGSVLGYLKATDPENDTIKYECQSQTVMCTSDGKVTLKRVLDRELSIKNPSLSATLLSVTFIAVEVNDKQDPSRNEKTITIFVKDINDNTPQFLNVPYQASVPENAPLNYTVFKGVSVKDDDSGVNAEVSLSCFQSNAEDKSACIYFDIETVRDPKKLEGRYNGNIILKKTLDYENKTSYVMTIQAKDKGSNVLSSSVNVLILVNDIQDNPPFFQQSPYTIFVPEETPVNEMVTKLKAQDGDTGNANPLKIEITNDPQGYFQIGPTVLDSGITYAANLSLKKPVDRETVKRYTFNISVTEINNGVLNPSAKAYSYVNVEILDSNDNAPRFMAKQYSMVFPEFIKVNSTGTMVGQPMVAADSDSASNAIFSLEVTSQTVPGVFDVTPKSGIKSTVVSLIALKPYYLDFDNEKYRNQTVVITARQTNNPRKLSTSTTVYITLTDQNDNRPVFKKSLYKVAIPEDTKVGTSILLLEATDKDSGKNGEVVFQISGSGSEYFSVDKKGNVILEKVLDYEFLNTFNLLAYARDQGEQSLISSADVIITITDVNDNGPVFNPKSYSTNVKEWTTTFEPIIKVQATDKDSKTTINYFIESGNTIDDAFEINQNTGLLTLKRKIKLEDAKGNSGTIFLKIKAMDDGSPPMTSFVVVNINILDSNDQAPTFLQQVYMKSLKEFTPRGTYVLTVNATDADQGMNAELEYSIESGSFDHFRIEPKTGKIYVATDGGLDYDVHSQYNMMIKAEDGGVPRLSGTATVIIKLIDINNKKPVFNQNEYSIPINEKIRPHTSILKVSATDNDDDSKLVYSINRRSITATKADGKILPLSTFDYSNAFIIDSTTGVIKTNMQFIQSLFPTISFEVLVTDINADKASTQTDQARVVIIIHASKRKNPYFIPEDVGQSMKIYRLTLPEDKQEGLRITRLQAIDPITGNGVTNYSLIADNSTTGFFNITNQGYVYLMKRLDYEVMEKNTLQFKILAIADPSRITTAEMQITILDVNDNAPKFERDDYTFNISETLKYPSTVGFVKATDKDSGSYSQIFYSIEGLGNNNFLVQPNGEIIVNQGGNLDYEKDKVYLLQITAIDNPAGDTHKKTRVRLTINILDVNDNNPAFFRTTYIFHASEMNDVGDSFGSVSANDIDSYPNNVIEYSLNPVYTDDGQPIFRMGRNSGKIFSGIKLGNVVKKNPITFTVTAKDQGIPQLTGQATVEVYIDRNKVSGRPQIIKPYPGQNITIPENQPVNSIVFVMIAKARENSSVIYSLDEPANAEIRKIFQLDENTGNVTLIAPLDYEVQSYHYLLVKATDRKNQTLQSTQRLRILVGDVDDNVPNFKSCDTYNNVIDASIQENYAVKSYVIKVTACDKDNFPFNTMRYLWKNASGCDNAMTNFSAFSLDTNNGVIESAVIFDYEDVKKYLLCVCVLPATNQAKTCGNDDDQVQRILVSIRDSNDNGPVFPNQQSFAVINEKTIFGSEVVMVTAVDPDDYLYNQVKYSIMNIDYQPPKSQSVYSAQTAFKVTKDTGVILTNLQGYTEFVRGDFLITLKAEDLYNSQFFNMTKVKIYVIQPRQRSRIVLPNNPKVNRGKTQELLRKLNALNIGHFRIQELHYHQGMNGIEDYDKTDVCLIIENDNHVLTLEENAKVLESAKVQKLLGQFDAETEGSCNPETSVNYKKWSVLWWVLVVFAIFIFICAVILIIAISLLYKSHKEFMESEKTSLIKN